MSGPCIAGIGASAGGYEAIRKLLQAMPADSGVGFVVVRHPDPTLASLAAELFGQFTAMPVAEATDGTLVEANHVYLSPSDKDISVRAGRLRLTPRGDHAHLHLPIDHFFSSLGQDCGARAIGMVLSGTGTDGTLGLKVIAAQGGLALAQDPATAQFDGMPRSAIAAGIANHVLPVEQMAQVIAGYAHHPYTEGVQAPVAEDGDPQTLQSLLTLMLARRGHDFSGYKRGTMLRRIQRRMGLHNMLRGADYVDLLEKDRREIDALFRDLLVGGTEFFRDAEAWKTLDVEVIAPLVAARPDNEPIRIWIPGCSTGEEAYTMAMVVLDRLRRAGKHCPVQIFATDTNNDALDVGRLGRYPAGIVARMPPERLRRYFAAGPDGQHYVVSSALRAAVVFGVQNLFADPPFGRVDLISCRNVLIHLEPGLQQRALTNFHLALRKDAFLLLGSAESHGGRDDLFKPVSRKWRIFRREGTTRADLLTLPLRTGELRQGDMTLPQRNEPPVSQVASLAQKLILDRFAPASVLIDSRNEALYFCGAIDEFLERPRGTPTRDLLRMVREGLRSRLRTALREAALSSLTVDMTGAPMQRAGGFVAVQITVTPVAGGHLGALFLVVFRHDPEPLPVPAADSAEGVMVRHLKQELQFAQDDLQNTIERFESANENLRVSNEGLLTAHEALRSLNEELTTANQQLASKVRALGAANSDLQNLLTSSDIATIWLDQSLRIKWFTPATQSQFQFIPGDIGRPISDFSLAWAGGGLIEAATTVLATGVLIPCEFRTESARRYIRRVLPYRAGTQQISGVIVTYTDITESQSAMDAADLAQRDLMASRDRNNKLRALSAALALAEERERRALAQDLHDDLGQLLAVVGIKAAAIRKQSFSEPLQAAVEECVKAIGQANRKLRTMAFQLNPPMLDQLGFAAALEWMIEELHRMYRLEVTVEDDGTPKPMEPAVSATLFRAVRELLINVAKHAGVDKATVITTLGDGNTLVVTVRDAGTGFDPDAKAPANGTGGFGLLSVRERLSLLGGEVQIRSNPGEGTTVILKAPLLTQTDAVTLTVPGSAP